MTKKQFRFLKGCELAVCRGYDINDKTKLITQKCSTCTNLIGYYSKSGNPLLKYKDQKCEECLKCA